MELGDGCNEGEPQACTGTIPGTLQPGESLERPSAILGGNPGSLVGHRERGRMAVGLLTEDDADGSSPSILERVLEQVRECLCQEMAVPLYPYSVFSTNAETESGFLGDGFVEFTCILDQGGEFHLDHFIVGPPGFDLGDMQQGIEGVEDLVQFFS